MISQSIAKLLISVDRILAPLKNILRIITNTMKSFYNANRISIVSY